MQKPDFPVISNVTGAQVDAVDEIKRTLQDQVTGTVRWTDCMERMLEMGCDLFLELGPGGVLAGLMQRTRKGTEVLTICDTASLKAASKSCGRLISAGRLNLILDSFAACTAFISAKTGIPEMNLPLLSSRSRVMLFAPHPDDESLAAGIFLQRAVAAGAAVRVVYATDGERNCWPQRVLEGKMRIRENDRRRWGARRRAEALAALRTWALDRLT